MYIHEEQHKNYQVIHFLRRNPLYIQIDTFNLLEQYIYYTTHTEIFCIQSKQVHVYCSSKSNKADIYTIYTRRVYGFIFFA